MAENQVIIPYLVAYFDRAERAKRYTMPGFIARELASYYIAKQKQDTTEAYYYGVIKGARRRIKQIKRQVTPMTDIDKAQRLYQEAINLQATIDEAEKWLNTPTNTN